MSEPEPTDDTDSEPDSVTVSEDKFNGTATLNIKAKNERHAEAGARRYFREVHGCKPSKIVVSEEPHAGMRAGPDMTHYVAMAANHTSGSLQGAQTYTFD